MPSCRPDRDDRAIAFRSVHKAPEFRRLRQSMAVSSSRSERSAALKNGRAAGWPRFRAPRNMRPSGHHARRKPAEDFPRPQRRHEPASCGRAADSRAARRCRRDAGATPERMSLRPGDMISHFCPACGGRLLYPLPITCFRRLGRRMAHWTKPYPQRSGSRSPQIPQMATDATFKRQHASSFPMKELTDARGGTILLTRKRPSPAH